MFYECNGMECCDSIFMKFFILKSFIQLVIFIFIKKLHPVNCNDVFVKHLRISMDTGLGEQRFIVWRSQSLRLSFCILRIKTLVELPNVHLD